MGLLAEIQGGILGEQALSPILLRLRFLAARLGSKTLEDWVKFEAEGYPGGADVPDYRIFGVSYYGSFNGSFGRTISNVEIPPYVIFTAAGERWLTHKERQSVSAIEDLVRSCEKANTNPQINSADLLILLTNKVFQGMACHSVSGIISRPAMVEMIATVRARIMDLTLELERELPEAADIVAGQAATPPEPEKAAVVTNITNQVFNGSVGTNVGASGQANIHVTVQQGDVGSLAKALVDGGLPETDATEFAQIVAAEKPEGPDQPFGVGARGWIEKNIGKALNGTWKIGVAVATGLLTAAAKHYYGL